jgi:hypothetical protein
MDNVVLTNRWIALYVGTQHIPGKKGKTRLTIGSALRFPCKGSFELLLGSVEIKAGETTMETPPVGPQQSTEFDDYVFARGIHKIAFNTFAYRFGKRRALEGKFDRLRRYIRQPAKYELWQYATWETDHKKMFARFYCVDEHWFVHIGIFVIDFVVSLDGRGCELRPRANNIRHVIRAGQWNASSLFGLKD